MFQPGIDKGHALPWLRLALLGFVMAFLAPWLGRTFGQAPIGGVGRGFKASETDAQGGRVTIQGKTSRTLAGGRVAFTGMTVEIARGTNASMIVEVAEGLYDSKSQIVISTNALTVRTSDERLAIQGTGFRYHWADSRLVISNDVQTVIRRVLPATGITSQPALVTNSATKANPAGAAARTNLPPSRIEPIEILSDHLDLLADLATFSGNVRAKDDQGLVTCGVLKAFLEPGGNSVKRIEAEQDVVFERGNTRAAAARALYLLTEDFVTLTGKPTWKVGENEGSCERLQINNKTREFVAEQQVRVKLPPRDMLPMDWLADASRTNSTAQSNRWITIHSEQLKYSPALAVFQGDVRIVEPQGTEIRCGVMTNSFSGPDGKLASLVLHQNVEFRQGDTYMRSDQATYETNSALVTLNGSPAWKIKQGEGSSDSVAINPKTQQMHAAGNVIMKLLGSGLESLDLSVRQSGTNSLSRTNQHFVIASDELFSRRGSTIFLHAVRVTSPDQPDHELACEVLAAFFAGAENKLDELIAEENVRIRQGDLRAAGSKVDYWVAKGFLEITGQPEIHSPGRRYQGDKIVLNRLDSTFRIIGGYKIVLDRQDLAAASGSGGKPSATDSQNAPAATKMGQKK